MIKLTNAALQRGQKVLFEDASFTLHDGYRCGISGQNGTGKSSLFQLILGQLAVDKGELSLPPHAVIAHVAQETPSLNQSAVEYVMDGDEPCRAAEREVVRYEAMEINTAEAATGMAEAIAEFERLGGYTMRARAAKLLDGLGFSPDQIDLPVSDFSGGWRMRLNLAQALMSPSDILLLDEPTNHLDMEAVLWLEQWLNRYQNTLLLISHDRDFLNAVCDHIIHLHQQDMTLYTGNYDDFERMRAEKMLQQQSAYTKQQAEIAHMEDYVRRFRAKATKAKQAQSRLKALERMTKIAPLQRENPFTFSFLPPERAGDPLLRLEQVGIGYGDQPVLTDVNLSFRAGDRFGVLGQNGSGKSTLIKFIAGNLTSQTGTIHQTDKLRTGYFAQHQMEALDGNASPLLIIQRLDKKATEQSIKNFLGGFNFKGDRVNDPVHIMSGGEKARLAMAALVWQKPNLLLLDEPTNHLDIQMRDAITLALQNFEGAILVISHDRYLLRACVDQFIWVHDGSVSPFDGDLDDYKKQLQQLKKQENATSAAIGNAESASNQKPTDTSANQTNTQKAARQLSAEQRQQLKPLRQKLRTAEQHLDKLLDKAAKLSAALADSTIYDDANKDKLQQLLAEHSDTKQQLEEVEETWMLLTEEMESAIQAFEV